MDNTNNNNSGFDARRGYGVPPQQQQAMYGYQPSPAGSGYQQHPINVMPATSTPGQGYNMQAQYPMNGISGRAQPQTYMASPGVSTMGQVMQQSHYPMSQAQYQPQTLSYQSLAQNSQSLPQLLVHPQYQAQQHQPQQYMRPQAMQAYQMDGAYSPPGMRQPQGNQNQHAPSSQQRPRHRPNPNETATTGVASEARPTSNTPSRPHQQSQPKPRESHGPLPSQSHPQPIASPSQSHHRTPSQPQPRAAPQTHKHAMSPPQPQSRPKPLSNSQPHPTSQQRPTSQMRSPQVIIETRRPSSQNATVPAPSRMSAPLPRESPIDLQPVLLGLADQYISKAHGISSYLARAPQEADVDQYYSLISAGLGCMESVLKNWKFSDPKSEARLQLRYANLLFEETENDGELQDLLTRGIALCERNRLVDLKYSMKHVQSRSLFRTHPRSAFKMVDQMIELTETYAHYSWIDLINAKPDQLLDKMTVMQRALDGGKRKTSPDGSFYVPTADTAPDDVSLDTCGIMEKTADGKRAIVFQWLRRSELFALGYILSGLASSTRNAVDHKSEKYVVEGDKLTQNDYNPENERKIQSLQSSSAHLDRRMFYHKLCLHLLASLRCERADWKGAQEVLERLTEGLTVEDVDEQDFVRVSALYLTGTVKQATGDLEGALECYRSPALTLQAGQKATINQDLRILATLNMVLILRPRSGSQDHIKHLMDLAEPLCENHANVNFKSAMYIVRASSTNTLPILKMKHYLSTSANIAKTQGNALLLCAAINLMTSNFFTSIMGEKAELSAGSGKRLADRTQVPLWQAVATQLLGNTFHFSGKSAEGSAARVEAERWMQMAPESIKQKFEVKR
ncbi:unnamed protein product, partial [Aureobasidium uvarum]